MRRPKGWTDRAMDAGAMEKRQRVPDARSEPPAQSRATADLASLIEALPEGWTRVSYGGRPYGLTRQTRAGGRSISVLAEELGGPDTVSANIHRTTGVDHLRPCEMPESKVMEFLRGWQPA